jgi:hypothetical protein
LGKEAGGRGADLKVFFLNQVLKTEAKLIIVFKEET